MDRESVLVNTERVDVLRVTDAAGGIPTDLVRDVSGRILPTIRPAVPASRRVFSTGRQNTERSTGLIP
jgi:hypothetical protein